MLKAAAAGIREILTAGAAGTSKFIKVAAVRRGMTAGDAGTRNIT